MFFTTDYYNFGFVDGFNITILIFPSWLYIINFVLYSCNIILLNFINLDFNFFRLKIQDGSEYLFSCSDEKLMLEWVAKIKFHASLTPSQQLRSFDMVNY